MQFGLKDLAELPTLKEFEEIRRLAIADECAPAEPSARRSERREVDARSGRRSSAGRGRSQRAVESETAGDARRRRRGSDAGSPMPEERLQKILSQAGVAIRRKAEQIILEGRVTVNGKVVTELGTKADLERDHIKVDGTLLRAAASTCLHRAEQARRRASPR